MPSGKGPPTNPGCRKKFFPERIPRDFGEPKIFLWTA
jgi:hypothetical protein